MPPNMESSEGRAYVPNPAATWIEGIYHVPAATWLEGRYHVLTVTWPGGREQAMDESRAHGTSLTRSLAKAGPAYLTLCKTRSNPWRQGLSA